ncbi:helix-turn-helix domain-containing protein [Ferrovum myxofaciens]|uniref:Helix-turn-helix transcriptional regulator n=1 Tax=Ferrovum myxofaciens TaxID=416213 RepID=A0A9E6MXP4_9PROT|nr:helix-turn-helix transcriptional regulator [Ferrovum myxofaciens]QSH81913.1 MAG: helix-turn-helix transcriptional regulator [Ferrovum myxofaciens]QWY74972.1 MAG: helix-turn-helix transcriptional regulator [Ferrovum myxofaciens]QWY77719.1 MAG: helix-turn-helix transcriptional regulator [Ferrovum myxofaciens]
MSDQYQAFIRRIDEVPARDAVIAYRAGRIGINDMAEVCWPYIMRLGSEIARRFSFSGTGNEDDFKSEVWITFVEKVVPRFEENWKGRKQCLTPLVLRFASRMAIRFKKDMNQVLSHEDWFDEKVGVDEIHPHDLITEISMDDINKAKAKQKIAQILLAGVDKKGYDTDMDNEKPLLPGLTPMSESALKDAEGSVSETNERSSAAIARQKKRGLDNKPDHAELRHIRETLGYSQAVMAHRLGIGVPTYSSYEYGRTGKVPEQIMTIAREELVLEERQVNTLRTKYKADMSNIVRRWAVMAGVDPDNNQELAALCGVSIPTISRWRNNQIKPELDALVRYEQNVTDRIAIRKKIEEKMKEELLAKAGK